MVTLVTCCFIWLRKMPLSLVDKSQANLVCILYAVFLKHFTIFVIFFFCSFFLPHFFVLKEIVDQNEFFLRDFYMYAVLSFYFMILFVKIDLLYAWEMEYLRSEPYNIYEKKNKKIPLT